MPRERGADAAAAEPARARYRREMAAGALIYAVRRQLSALPDKQQ
ncbi:hypothetical protein AB0H60_19470 [Nocardia rhamnosiphila]|nr:hypothetical protein [Nocardia zapadnayensis]